MTRKRRFSSDKEKEIFKIGQFISYKTGQIYLLVTGPNGTGISGGKGYNTIVWHLLADYQR